MNSRLSTPTKPPLAFFETEDRALTAISQKIFATDSGAVARYFTTATTANGWGRQISRCGNVRFWR
jgi:hypothetical protein